jgi:4-hydroxy-tetrahydrodipicolinate synthase
MNSSKARKGLQARLFPAGIPRLWCPSLTHFCAMHRPDANHINIHLSSLSSHMKGILVPGSTGEGWEMNDQDIHNLVSIVTEVAQSLDLKVLIGVLKTNTEDMLRSIEAMQNFLSHEAVVGFTVCPASGSGLTQQVIQDGLSAVLREGFATALYQLPQVTKNEVSPETVASLASEFPNLIMFKDTSGEDRVAKSGLDFGGVFMVRGSEQAGYAQWLRQTGGPYDGFLLSTANVFAKEYSRMIEFLDAGHYESAQDISEQVRQVVDQAFAIVEAYESGNAFTNANKILDHCFAHGDNALNVQAPLLYGGNRLPMEFVSQMLEYLTRHPVFTLEGYMNGMK